MSYKISTYWGGAQKIKISTNYFSIFQNVAGISYHLLQKILGREKSQKQLWKLQDKSIKIIQILNKIWVIINNTVTILEVGDKVQLVGDFPFSKPTHVPSLVPNMVTRMLEDYQEHCQVWLQFQSAKTSKSKHYTFQKGCEEFFIEKLEEKVQLRKKRMCCLTKEEMKRNKLNVQAQN